MGKSEWNNCKDRLYTEQENTREICKYYLSRVDLCTNIRCDNKQVFRELVGKYNPDQPYRSYEACLNIIERSCFPEQTQSNMRTLITQMQRKQMFDAALR